MKKALLSLGAALLGVALMSAQRLPAPVSSTLLPLQRSTMMAPVADLQMKAPVRKALGQNQLYMGPYTSDALAEYGLGLPGYPETFKMGTLLPLSIVQPFNGGVVKAIRIGLCAPITDGQVFIYPVTKASPLTLQAAVVEQDVASTVAGWNTVELETPYTINTEGLVGLLIGYQYTQKNTSSGGYYTNDCYPISVVEEGEILTSYTYGKLGGSRASWQDVGLSDYGNLSVQAIVEGDFSTYNFSITGVACPRFAQIDGGLPVSVSMSNVSTKPLDSYKIEMKIDGEAVATIDSPVQGVGQAVVTASVPVSLDNVTSGAHTLTAKVVEVAGEAVDGNEVSAQFTAYGASLPRQKQLVEHVTSNTCTYCYLGDAVLEALDNMRDDIAWVSIHGNLNATDPFNSTKCNSIMNYLGANSFPSGAFNRYDFEGSGSVVTGLGYYDAAGAAAYLSEAAIDANPTPSLASVDINGTLDQETRELKLTVSGNATDDFTAIFGTQVALTVYLVEDSLVARQYSNGVWNNNFVHNHVMRDVLGTTLGNTISWNGDGTYTNNFTTTLNSAWNIDKMRVIAFVHRKGSGVNKEVINTEMINLTDLLNTTPPVLGDLNLDDKVDIDDVNLMINIMLEMIDADQLLNVTDSIYGNLADLDGNGAVDVDDLNKLINIMLEQ